jgi:hypothetical protein
MKKMVLAVCFSLSFSCSPTVPISDAGNSDAGNNDAGTPTDASVAFDSGMEFDSGVFDSGTMTDAGMTGAEMGDGISRETVQFRGQVVDKYRWVDSKQRPRTVSLKRQGEGNPGNGGYALEMTYDVESTPGVFKTITVNAPTSGESGFGYFVSHEQQRNFGAMGYESIASLHGEDDSPLGSGFSILSTVRSSIVSTSTAASIRFEQRYPHWGTKVAMPDVTAQTSATLTDHQKFELPIFTQWTFEKNTDFPRIDIKVDLTAIVPGQLAFDVRGPYGVIEFADGDSTATLSNVQWSDSSFQFSTSEPTNSFLKSNSPWTWNTPKANGRQYHAMTARQGSNNLSFEIGLIEHVQSGETGLVNASYSYRWNETSATPMAPNLVNLNWSFQSAQFSGLSAMPATFKKFAWGSAAFYGSANSAIFNGSTMGSTAFNSRAGMNLVYRTCLILAVPSLDSRAQNSLTLTRVLANSSTALSCSSGLLMQ